jgi:predicted HicB family RNase H-like nuclease
MNATKFSEKPISLRLPEDLEQEIRRIAQEQQRPLNNLVRVALSEWVRNHQKPEHGKAA